MIEEGKKMDTLIDIKELWINGSKEDWKIALESYFDNASVKNT